MRPPNPTTDGNVYLGLDLETSGTSHWEHVPIQIGAAYDTPKGPEYFRRNIGRWPWRDYPRGGRWLWDHEAEQVHGISRTIIDQAEAAPTVDGLITAWRKDKEGLGSIKRFSIVPVGWNVAGFDRPFISRHLPHFNASIGYRSIDLNAVVFHLTSIGMTRPSGPAWSYKDLKRHVQEQGGYFADQWQVGGGLHDAAWDAVAAIYALRELRILTRQALGKEYRK